MVRNLSDTCPEWFARRAMQGVEKSSFTDQKDCDSIAVWNRLLFMVRYMAVDIEKQFSSR